MVLKLRRSRNQRNVRVLLAFALAIPAAGLFQAAGANPVAITVAAIVGALVVALIYDAYRWVAILTRHGVGIAGAFGTATAWLAWGEFVGVELDEPVVSLTTRDRRMYQIELGYRAGRLLSRMIERHLTGATARPGACRSSTRRAGSPPTPPQQRR